MEDILASEMALTDDRLEIYSMAARFAANVIAPRRQTSDLYPLTDFDGELLKKWSETGSLQLLLPEKCGGAGMSLQHLNALLYGLSTSCASYAVLTLTHIIAADTLARFTESTESLASHDLIAYPLYQDALDEHEDILRGDECLTGIFRSLSLAPVADLFLLPVSSRGKTELQLIARKTEGITVHPPQFMHGLRQAPVGDVEMHRFPIENVEVVLSDGKEILRRQRNRFTPAVLAIAGGIALGSYQEAEEYMKVRYQTGTLLSEKPFLRSMLMRIKVIAIEALHASERLAQKADQGELTDSEALPSFVHFRDQIAEVVDSGVQLLGGYGYMRDFGQEKRYRDARQLQAVFGMSEVLLSDAMGA